MDSVTLDISVVAAVFAVVLLASLIVTRRKRMATSKRSAIKICVGCGTEVLTVLAPTVPGIPY